MQMARAARARPRPACRLQAEESRRRRGPEADELLSNLIGYLLEA